MKIRYKVSLAAACVLLITTSLLSLAQVSQVRTVLRTQAGESILESSTAVARQIENWLNGKLHLMDLTVQSIASPVSQQTVQRITDSPLLKQEFALVFGALQVDGKPIGDLDTWKPKPGYDGRTRPWYATGEGAARQC